MSEPELTCAVWFIDWRGSHDYELGADESDAASYVAALEEYSDRPPSEILGAQFSDGRTVRADQWAALHEARERIRNEARALRGDPSPPAATRQAVDPFEGAAVRIELTEPSWLGRPAP